MSTSSITNADLKSSKKKRSKAEATTISEAASTPTPSTPTASEPTTNGLNEFPFLKELQKNLRNSNKKLNATTKVDSIIAENPGKSLDDLVAEKKINNDQKAQALKKPALQATIAQIEHQISQFKQYGEYYEDRIVKQKSELEEAHKKELERVRMEAAEEATRAADKALRDRLLALTRFLRAASTVRISGDETSNNSRAFEGVLLQIYEGGDDAVSAMVKLIHGSNDQVPAVDGELLDITYDRIKQASMNYSPSGPVPDATRDQEPQMETQPAEVTQSNVESPATDPTIAHAGMTELQDPSVAEAAATSDMQQHEGYPPSQTIVPDNAANPVAQGDSETQPTVSVPVEEQAQEAQPSAEAAEAPTNGASVESAEQSGHHIRQNSGRGRGFRGRGHYRGRGGHFRGDFRRGRGRGRDGEIRGRRGGHSAQNSGPSTPPAQ